MVTPTQDTLLVIIHWTPPESWISAVSQALPNLRIICHQVSIWDTEVPDLPEEVWKSVTVLATRKLYPTPEMVPNLRFVQVLSGGCNQIHGLPLYEKTDITFATASGIHGPQMAEWVFSTYLSFQHHIPQYMEYQKENKWMDPESDEDTEDAVGLRVGLLGYGSVGRQCARVAKALGMDVYAYTYHDRSTSVSRKANTFTVPGTGDPNGELPSKWYSAEKNELNTFLASDLDLLVITAPITKDTKGLIGREQFDILSKKKPFLSNASRGKVINTDALLDALHTGKIRGAALDKTDPEPLPSDHELWNVKNVIITPHCGGCSTQYNERGLKILKGNLERWMKREEVSNKVDRALGY
ncbi:hypothetical protein ASPWEDRAFT_28246 [Aspergillus wentii DTO 134E9]|uniref:D-isomer specific 2-hydroxyacid dehydrogenase NAD-binding domain-containing protein n=1 Tax=Aspergillus wentii DTO 134E9 TaxID=1073089 RepID=A0A1L9RLB9_ASPWE|nr:uncharacterized protein ASPWEDRAFT_28246 [Aspergillus wentii DTO 134E9]KAI9924608.1 hypothetical protein MW887_006881 [Aspergillus wentii]OJJ35628.1 hypothetical protein ASPWEDRAFT_28246 [Aspergillus wentii DTO 134E9]